VTSIEGRFQSEDPTPLTGGELDRWLASLDPDSRSMAAVVGGLDFAEVGYWRALTQAAADVFAADVGAEFVPPRDASRFLSWNLPAHRRVLPADADLAQRAGPWLANRLDLTSGYRAQPPAMRVALEGNVIPAEILPRLLACPRLGSAVLPVRRPPGALRQRPMSWPLRVGVVDDDLLAAFMQVRETPGSPRGLLDVSNVRIDPARVDLLILREEPERAAEQIGARRPLANMVLCFGQGGGLWPVVEAYLALARAATGAVASILADAQMADVTTIVSHVLGVAILLRNDYPLDIAFTAGFDRRVVIIGELEALAETTADTAMASRSRQLRHDYDVLQTVADPADLGAALPPLIDLERNMRSRGGRSRGVVDGSRGAIAAPADEVDAVLDAAAVPRRLQVNVGPVDETQLRDNIIRAGANAIDIFVGPLEASALTGAPLPETDLFDDPATNHVNLTVVLVPLEPRAAAARAELEVPRVGRSTNASLIWNVSRKGGLAQARILLLHQNRVIQTGLLSGQINAAATLVERIVLWQKMNHLDDRTRFDRTFVLNHDDTGRDAIISHSDGITTVASLPEIDAITDRMRGYLVDAASQRTLSAAKIRRILIDVAVEGNDLYGTLQDYLGSFAQAQRIQIVTARPGRFLPLEMIYDRAAPDDNAKLCANWTSAAACGAHCFASEDDTTIVCPSVFWGLGKVIERHHASFTEGPGTDFEVSAEPTRDRRTLKVTHAALAASSKVLQPDRDLTVAALGSVASVASWDAWVRALQKTPTDLLVLMPHSVTQDKELEISGTRLRNGRIERKHVTGGHANNAPVVVLFGCDTSGTTEDPAGYAGRFMAKGAAVVLSTLSILLNTHAAQMSQRLASVLREPSRAKRPMGELVTAFRRESVRAGLVSALSVAAYGDADWTV
jgi:hypothetical protein